ncbi:MAG: L-seryl-tRNA(Sec) selenium transferase [Chloroflexi bacterium]|jgi:L-seryl-tRNA(Ser) seleniumtransferase|nr:L-seryl-tRNA(Sec) selenium transferase [Chloroflexota bacterium]HOE34264.1 L-seryl-tRNA(Sec) selenium transferase [Anaerolineaceae bacterium]HOT25896.1 L-seryl-tRNA(Sec) selenium transferase [Anaerolineaceae bacterium]HQH58045.1 L-seryl-tRNA(Sec) selenium transferase [Anaerolineaceae bacterium]HQK04093.1 L-seryl-tRNA(Sec) selenium transferase [Anaerolineaceae bacterium]
MDAFRHIPSVEHLLTHARTGELIASFGREWTANAIREVLAEYRQELRAGMPLTTDDEILITRTAARLNSQAALFPVHVINATGVVLHTNLGRAPLSAQAMLAVASASGGYSNLEYELSSGKRGSRNTQAENLLIRLTGAEAALVVNNNSGAVLLALTALARRKKVAVARSQLVEIGGGFRVPDVLRESGARLLEIGTTNRVHLRDYQLALEQGAQVLLLTHHSNFKIIGFTTEPTLQELAGLAASAGVPVIFDQGSGALLDTARWGLPHEITVQEALQAGADLVCFSGDKLLGGPQAGIIAGKKALVDKLRRHALYRALRPDKLCLAALTATLLHYLKGEAETLLPVYQMLSRPEAALRDQALSWQQQLGFGSLISGRSTIGGGSLPEETLPTWLLALEVRGPQKLLARLRASKPAIIARVENNQVVFDPRTVLPDEDQYLLAGIRTALRQIKEQ